MNLRNRLFMLKHKNIKGGRLKPRSIISITMIIDTLNFFNLNYKNERLSTIGQILAVDRETGEELDNVVILTREQIRERKAYAEHDAEKRRIKEENLELGHFIFNIYKTNKNLNNLKPQTAARLVYLATFLDYTNNRLMTSERKPMTKTDLKSVMNLKAGTFKNFYNEIIENGYLLPIENNLHLNKKYFDRGKLDKLLNPARGRRFTKIYIEATRNLYLTTSQTNHVYLGHIFQMIPHINLQWNIVCHNPLQVQKSQVQPMSVGEFCEAIGYDKNNAARLVRELRRITFVHCGYEQKFCSFVYEPDKSQMKIFVNPRIFYAGEHWKEVDVLGVFFDNVAST